ncbi:MAG: hypothetical protein N2C14_30220, partial [Planctomycetales bacterium]
PGMELGSKASDLPDDSDDARDKTNRDKAGDGHEEDEDDLFHAAYEDMTFRDSAEDGIEGETVEFGPTTDADEWSEMSQWMIKRLRFLSMLADLWRLAVARHATPSEEAADDLSEVLGGWFRQAHENQQGLLRLLKAILKRRIPPPTGSEDSRVEYDRRSRMQLVLAHQVLNAFVSTHRAATALLVALPDDDALELMEQCDLPLWEQLAVRLHRAAWLGERRKAEDLFGATMEAVSEQPLLYGPLDKGGDPQKVAAAHALQQIVADLQRCLPRVGLFHAAYVLLRTAREMERRHPVGPRAVTEFDRLFQFGFQAVVQSLAAMSNSCSGDLPEEDANESDDDELVKCLETITETLLREWQEHSQSLRLSAMERVVDDSHWRELVRFIKTYGRDLFTPRFFHLGNLQAILQQGVPAFLKAVEQEEDALDECRLLRDLDAEISRAEAVAHLDLILEAIVENYEEYKDYNTITTQSDSGDNLYMLLDFLRLK